MLRLCFFQCSTNVRPSSGSPGSTSNQWLNSYCDVWNNFDLHFVLRIASVGFKLVSSEQRYMCVYCMNTQHDTCAPRCIIVHRFADQTVWWVWLKLKLPAAHEVTPTSFLYLTLLLLSLSLQKTWHPPPCLLEASRSITSALLNPPRWDDHAEENKKGAIQISLLGVENKSTSLGVRGCGTDTWMWIIQDGLKVLAREIDIFMCCVSS